MIVLLPNTSVQTISILPRSNDLTTPIVISIRRDGDGVSETIENPLAAMSGDFVNLSFSSTILKEDATYYLTITNSNELWYRDKIYSTVQQDSVNNLKDNHVIGNNTIYETYNKSDDNTYVI